jgi:hypothetical protein
MKRLRNRSAVAWRDTPSVIRGLFYSGLGLTAAGVAGITAITVAGPRLPTDATAGSRPLLAAIVLGSFGLLLSISVWTERRFSRAIAIAATIAVAIPAATSQFDSFWFWAVFLPAVGVEWSSLYASDDVYDYYLKLADARRLSASRQSHPLIG